LSSSGSKEKNTASNLGSFFFVGELESTQGIFHEPTPTRKNDEANKKKKKKKGMMGVSRKTQNGLIFYMVVSA
jgi:hypothetical protein